MIPSRRYCRILCLEAMVLLFFIATVLVRSANSMYIIDVIRTNLYQRGDLQEKICCMFRNDLQITHSKYLQMLFDDTADVFLMTLPLLWIHNMIWCWLKCCVMQRNCCFPLIATVKKPSWIYMAKLHLNSTNLKRGLLALKIHKVVPEKNFWNVAKLTDSEIHF